MLHFLRIKYFIFLAVIANAAPLGFVLGVCLAKIILLLIGQAGGACLPLTGGILKPATSHIFRPKSVNFRKTF
jgi:hypothetical protein